MDILVTVRNKSRKTAFRRCLVIAAHNMTFVLTPIAAWATVARSHWGLAVHHRGRRPLRHVCEVELSWREAAKPRQNLSARAATTTTTNGEYCLRDFEKLIESRIQRRSRHHLHRERDKRNGCGRALPQNKLIMSRSRTLPYGRPVLEDTSAA
ncbi:hypothetical protein FI667_g10020, partial [Globisporangium splendens]